MGTKISPSPTHRHSGTQSFPIPDYSSITLNISTAAASIPVLNGKVRGSFVFNFSHQFEECKKIQSLLVT